MFNYACKHHLNTKRMYIILMLNNLHTKELNRNRGFSDAAEICNVRHLLDFWT